jgi:hypothetical protein
MNIENIPAFRTQGLRLVKKESAIPRPSLWGLLTKHPSVKPYNRLAVGILILNLLVYSKVEVLSLQNVLNFTLLNFSAAILIRQQYVINLLFHLATSAPQSWPIQIRWALGKVYHFGGIHVGGFFCGTAWLATSIGHLPSAELRVLVVLHLILLGIMMVAALPVVRAKHHNQFELVARFGGWASIALFWLQTIMLGQVFSASGALLLPVTFSVALPWLRLKKVRVDLLVPSNHVALAKFNYGVTPFAGSSTDLSRNPLLEWHSFANVPSPGEDGFRLTISRAGDWTGRLIDEKPTHLWVKGIPTAGVGNVEKLFKKVVWVATGSGIGPCLPHLLSGQVPAMLVWSTRNPRKTYGDALVNEILRVQPNAIIWDTDSQGKPDLVKLSYEAFKTFDAEAVICIANKKVTFHVNYQMESRGIPAFGAIWDS